MDVTPKWGISIPDARPENRAPQLRIQAANIEAALSRIAVEGHLNLANYNPYGDGVGDDSTALSNALADAMLYGGRMLIIPQGKFRIAAAVAKSALNCSILIKGVGNGSQFIINCSSAVKALRFATFDMVKLEDLAIVGKTANPTDALVALSFNAVDNVLLERVNFYGVSSGVANGSVLEAEDCNLTVNNSLFYGCSGNSANESPVIRNTNWRSVRLRDTYFRDYGTLEGTYHSKTGMGTAHAWVMAQTPQPKGNYLDQSIIDIDGCRWDEGALYGVFVRGNIGVDPTAQMVRIQNCSVNSNNIDAPAIYCQNVENLEVLNSLFGFATLDVSFLRLQDVRHTLVQNVYAADVCSRIDYMTPISFDGVIRLHDSKVDRIYAVGGVPRVFYRKGRKTLSDRLLPVGMVQVADLDAEAINGPAISIDGTLAANSDAIVSTQKAIKTYADTKQPLDATLTALAAHNSAGLLTQTAADAFTGRTITGTADQVVVANGSGVAGNPTLSLAPLIQTSRSGGSAGFIATSAGDIPGYRSVMGFNRARNTVAAPAVPLVDDYIGSFLFAGWDGSAYQSTALIDAYIDGAVSAGVVPTRISFVTSPNSEANRAERLVINSVGNIGIGTRSFGTSAAGVLGIKNGTAPSTGPADTVQFYSSDDAAGHTIPSFYCEGTNVVATGQADAVSSVRVKMRINGVVRTFLCI